MKNILLRNLEVFDRNQRTDAPAGFEYDNVVGAWVSKQNKTNFLVMSQSPDVPNVGTKKNDMETGEDQKGE